MGQTLRGCEQGETHAGLTRNTTRQPKKKER